MFVSHCRIDRQQREGSHVFIVTLLVKSQGFIFQLDFLIKFEQIATTYPDKAGFNDRVRRIWKIRKVE